MCPTIPGLHNGHKHLIISLLHPRLSPLGPRIKSEVDRKASKILSLYLQSGLSETVQVLDGIHVIAEIHFGAKQVLSI